MSIQPVTMYSLYCDNCGVRFEYDDNIIAGLDAENLREIAADDADWRQVKGRDLCRRCWLREGDEDEDEVEVTDGGGAP